MPKLKKKVGSLDDVEEQYRPLYKEEGGEFVLTIDIDTPPDPKVKEFRETNTQLMGQNRTLKDELETLKARYGDTDPQELKRLREMEEKAKSDKEKELLKAGDLDGVLALRTANQQADHKKVIDAKDEAIRTAQGTASSYLEELTELKVDAQVDTEVAKVGKLRPGARADAVARARRIFKLDKDGKTMNPDASGEIVYGKDGQPLKMEEWAGKLLEEAPHLFEPSQGGGGGGNEKPGGGGGQRTPAGRKDDKGRLVIPNDPRLIGKHSKEIAEGKVLVEGFPTPEEVEADMGT